MEATLTSKGQITIPKPVREALHLRTGDRVEFVLEADGTVRMFPVTSSVNALKGMLPKPGKPVSLAAIERDPKQTSAVELERLGRIG
jgi:AbrB family looped-hinge helix DNA binding protein